MAGWDWCAVVDGSGIVVGRIRGRQLEESQEAEARDVMEPGPATYRPSLPAAELLKSMREGGFGSAFVTDSEGRWIGLVTREALEAAGADDLPL